MHPLLIRGLIAMGVAGVIALAAVLKGMPKADGEDGNIGGGNGTSGGSTSSGSRRRRRSSDASAKGKAAATGARHFDDDSLRYRAHSLPKHSEEDLQEEMSYLRAIEQANERHRAQLLKEEADLKAMEAELERRRHALTNDMELFEAALDRMDLNSEMGAFDYLDAFGQTAGPSSMSASQPVFVHSVPLWEAQDSNDGDEDEDTSADAMDSSLHVPMFPADSLNSQSHSDVLEVGSTFTSELSVLEVGNDTLQRADDESDDAATLSAHDSVASVDSDLLAPVLPVLSPSTRSIDISVGDSWSEIGSV
ncbi:hypothetical protein THASP1DRAFT_22145 [Thamnocephalis sphaerospora]|uniref:Uncharacterized protein n=1 Tax=Thamnocephalis sphaerospora TaxID=78915 RepID=A0A4P9XV25_9FUNG|nr:hypothetical protein THASP1DRAFT_22145 [Thamnocephalis sphaerospora]|eukprot:RKP10103.1 hypothetical protein THASP1DRAFT_22145 [Thamnocephalis sphaerospora]